MENLKVAQQMLNFNKNIIDNTYTGMSVMQDYSENIMDGFLRQFPWITEENKKPIYESMNFWKKARSDYKEAMDQNFAKLEEMTVSK